ncbi:MAG: penicillin-binding transpeptidase domain-containing protein [Thermaerobacterales bacterium]
MQIPGVGLRKRILVLFLASGLALILLIGRLGYIQFFRGPELQAQALDNRLWNISVEPKRGLILDRNGNTLALSINAETVYVVPAEVRDPAGTAARLSGILDTSYDEVYDRVTRPVAWWYVKRKISDEQAREVREARLPGIYLTQESRRIYPKGTLAAHLIGFAGIDSQGLEGLEVFYDEELRGRTGWIEIEFDARGREIPQALQHFDPPEDGHNLTLTLDENIQHVVERELDRAMLAHGAKSGTVLVYEPCSGGVLAMASRPVFDPNRFSDFPSQIWRNPVVSDTIPPGSAFKPLTAAAALEEGVVTPASRFHDPGHLKVPGHTIHNWNRVGLGSTDFATGFEKSANTIFSKVAMNLGLAEFYNYIHGFGLDSRTGIDLPGEAMGIRPRQENARPVDLAVMGFGQTLTVTPIQMAAAVGAIACDGRLMRPHLASEIRDQDGELVRRVDPEPVRQVVSPATAQTVRELMGRVVDNGTGVRAQIEGYSIGGKTGTSQKIEGGRIAAGRYIASFIGIAPISDPQVLVYVLIDEPQGIYYGGWVAAPVAGAIMRDVLHYLQIPPDDPDAAGPDSSRLSVDPTRVPNVVNLSLAEAEQVLNYAGLKLKRDQGVDENQGMMQRVTGQFPASGARVKTGVEVVVTTTGEDVENVSWTLVSVPELAAATPKEAADLLAAVGLRLDAIGDGVVDRQDPAPGERVPGGSYVRVVFSAAGAGREDVEEQAD